MSLNLYHSLLEQILTYNLGLKCALFHFFAFNLFADLVYLLLFVKAPDLVPVIHAHFVPQSIVIVILEAFHYFGPKRALLKLLAQLLFLGLLLHFSLTLLNKGMLFIKSLPSGLLFFVQTKTMVANYLF
jgi:hypothetical protein